MGLDLGQSVSALVVFAQGLLGFFSPCVLPIVPLYAAYLAGGAGDAATGDGTDGHAKKNRLLINTLCFILGISCTFFLLGAGATALGQALGENRGVLEKVGGIVVIVFGIVQFFAYDRGGLFGRELRLPFDLGRFAMNPLVAFALGFFFSFAWTPCVGPALTSVLIMASSANSSALGFLLIGVYTLGFALPFLAIGFAADRALGFFRRHRDVAAVTVKIGAVLLVIMGILMVTGWMNAFSRSVAILAA